MAKKNSKKAHIFVEASLNPSYNIDYSSKNLPKELKGIQDKYKELRNKSSDIYWKSQDYKKELVTYLKGYIDPSVYDVIAINGGKNVFVKKDDGEEEIKPYLIEGLKGVKPYENFIKTTNQHNSIDYEADTLAKSFNTNPLNIPSRDSTFIKEGNKLANFYNNKGIDSEVTPVYGQQDTTLVNKANISPKDDVALFGHSGRKLGGIPTKWWNKKFAKTNPDKCLLGTCTGDKRKDEFKDVKNLYRTNKNSWYGVNPKADDLNNAMFSTRFIKDVGESTLNVDEGEPPFTIDNPRKNKLSNGGNINNTDMRKTKRYAKVPKHALGAIIGAASTALNVFSTFKANADAKKAAMLAKNQHTQGLLTEDQYLLDNYPVEGNEIKGYYKKGGKMNLVGYKAKGGNLLPMSSDMDLVDGNKHGQSTIDNTNGVKLLGTNGQPVAEVEDEEVIKDDEKVYSDRLKLKNGRTYAQEAERIGKKKGEAEAILNDPNAGRLKKNGAKLKVENWTKAADDLFNHQEQMKKEQGITDEGTPKKEDGGTIDDKKFNLSGLKKALPFLDNAVNAVLTAATPKPAFPQLARTKNLKTDFNIEPQLGEITDTVNQVTEGIEKGTSNANVAQQRTTATRLAGMKEKGKLYGQKENIETELENQNTINQQRTEAGNLARIGQFNQSMNQRSYNVQGRATANVANVVEDVNKQDHADAIKKYQDEQLSVISDTYNVNGTSLRADLNNQYEVESLNTNSTYRDARAKQYLAKDTMGNLLYPKEAAEFLKMFPDYNN